MYLSIYSLLTCLVLPPDGRQFFLQFWRAQVKHVQHHGELDVLQDLGIHSFFLLVKKSETRRHMLTFSLVTAVVIFYQYQSQMDIREGT